MLIVISYFILVLFCIFIIFTFLSMYIDELNIPNETKDLSFGIVIILFIIYYIVKIIYFKNKKNKNRTTPEQREEIYDIFDNHMFNLVNY